MVMLKNENRCAWKKMIGQPAGPDAVAQEASATEAPDQLRLYAAICHSWSIYSCFGVHSPLNKGSDPFLNGLLSYIFTPWMNSSSSFSALSLAIP
jgi:hypothetical protein